MDNKLRDELLKQSGKSASDQAVSGLYEIIAKEKRQTRRLVYLTLGVWGTWILFITLALVIPVLSRTSRPPATTQPTTAPIPGPAQTGSHSVLAALGIILVVFIWLGLPLAGIILTVVLITTRRNAGLNQIRVSLAAIESQLQKLRETNSNPDDRKAP